MQKPERGSFLDSRLDKFSVQLNADNDAGIQQRRNKLLLGVLPSILSLATIGGVIVLDGIDAYDPPEATAQDDGIATSNVAAETVTEETEETEEQKSMDSVCGDLPFIDHTKLIQIVPDSLVVGTDGGILVNEDIYEPTNRLSFPGLADLTAVRESIYSAQNLTELGSVTDEAFDILGLDVSFNSDDEYPPIIVGSSSEKTYDYFYSLLVTEKDLPYLKEEIDQLYIDESFIPIQWATASKRKGVVITNAWSNPGEAFTETVLNNGDVERETYYLNRLSRNGSRLDNSNTNAHERVHNFSQATCDSPLNNAWDIEHITPFHSDIPRWEMTKSGKTFDSQRFISLYGATSGSIEDYAETGEDLHVNGYPEPSKFDTPVDQKRRIIVAQHEHEIPGSALFMTALAAGKLCFDIEVDESLYPEAVIPQVALTC